jgi:glycosyltransferase involved in cell wall biosynthesis
MTMGDHNLVSIIIPCFNAERYLRETLDCALAQTYRPLEIILVDDGSKDQTSEIARSRDSSIIVIRHENNRGLNHARNTGLRHARGAYIQFLDSDDLITCDKLERQAAVLDADPSCDVVFSEVHEFRDRVENARPEAWREHKERQDPLGAFLVVDGMAIHAPLIRRSCVERAHGFAADLPIGGEDWDFWIRACLQGTKFTFLPGVLAYYRKHASSLSWSVSNYYQWEQVVLSRAIEQLRAHGVREPERWHALALGLTRLAVCAQQQGKREEATRLIRRAEEIRPPIDADFEQHSFSAYGARMSTSYLGFSLEMLRADYREAAAELLKLANVYLSVSHTQRSSDEKAIGLRLLLALAQDYRQRTGRSLRERVDIQAWAAAAKEPSVVPLVSARLLDELGCLEEFPDILGAAARLSEGAALRSLLYWEPNLVSSRREWLLLRGRQMLVRAGVPQLSAALASLRRSRRRGK